MLNVNSLDGEKKKKNEKYEMSREIKKIKRCRRMAG